MSSDLVNSDGTRIPLFDKNYKYFLNKSILLYGSSNSGKSTIMRDILYVLRQHIPAICIISPTNSYNKTYDDMVPKQLIHQDVTEDLIKRIFNRQKMAVKLWNYTVDLQRLEGIYSKMPKSESDNNELNKIIQGYHIVKNKITNNEAIHVVDKKISLQNLDEVHKETLISFYKRIITKNKCKINKSRYSEIEIKIMSHININPNFLLIMDDTAANANVWCKYQEIKDLFFQGRHFKITFMISFQDDKLLESTLRKNAFINIFTTEVVCNSFFQRTANNFRKSDKDKMAKCADTIFNDPKLKDKNFKKLVYIKDQKPDVYYMIAEHFEHFTFGSPYLIQLCKKIMKDESNTKNDDDLQDFQRFF